MNNANNWALGSFKYKDKKIKFKHNPKNIISADNKTIKGSRLLKKTPKNPIKNKLIEKNKESWIEKKLV